MPSDPPSTTRSSTVSGNDASEAASRPDSTTVSAASRPCTVSNATIRLAAIATRHRMPRSIAA